MLHFRVFQNGTPPAEFDLATAYLIGSDGVPMRSELFYADGLITCRKRAPGPAALYVPWATKNFGCMLTATTRLPERDEPYNLNLELARSRVMRLLQKREEWGLFDIAEAAQVNEKWNAARDLLLEALTRQDNPAQASLLADKCLQIVMPLSEQAALTHADLLLQRRIATRNFPKGAFGIRAEPVPPTEAERRLLMGNVDFVRMPMHWKTIEPREHEFTWDLLDGWMDFLRRARIPVVAGPLVHFQDVALPEWLYIWEHDYETIRDLLYEHMERAVSRYANQVVLWDVVSGLHVNSRFSLTFDQIMDLTRMAVGLVKKIKPNARTMIEITRPWSEYYATNQRSIPALLYAEMLVQSGIQFDVFGVSLRFGVPRIGLWQRDLFQISSLLDRFAPLGKPVMISSLQAPSLPYDSSPGTAAASPGIWRTSWSESLQAKWLEAVTDIALSKPYVEAICWHDLTDTDPARGEHVIPNGGLARADGTPKLAAKSWSALRRAVLNFRQPAPPASPTPPAPPKPAL